MAVLDQLGFAPVGLRRVSNKQLRLWAGDNGTPTRHIYTIINGTGALVGISQDPDQDEHVFHTGGDMIEGDALAVRIQALLGMSDSDWSLAISDMLDYAR